MSSLKKKTRFGGEIIIVDEGAELDSGDEEHCYDSLEDVKIGKRNSSSQRRKLPSVPPPVPHLTPDNVGDSTGSLGDLQGRVSKCVKQLVGGRLSSDKGNNSLKWPNLD